MELIAYFFIVALVVVGLAVYGREQRLNQYEQAVHDILDAKGCPYYDKNLVVECYDHEVSPTLAAIELDFRWKEILRKATYTGESYE